MISYKDVSCIEIAKALGLKQSENGNFHCFQPHLHNNKDKHASLSISQSGFHCFACGCEGNNVELVKMVLSLETSEAIKKIEEIATIGNTKISSDSTPARNKTEKVHCRMISDTEPRFVWLEKSKLKLREAELRDLSNIYEKIEKVWNLKALTQLGVKVSDEPYCLSFPFKSQLYYFNPKNAQSYLVCEGRTDLITLVSIGVCESFGIISRYNKSQKIKLSNGSRFYFLLDSDEKTEELVQLIEEIPEKAELFAVHLPAQFKDISEWNYKEPLGFFDKLLHFIIENYNDSSLNYEIEKLEIKRNSDNKFKKALDEVRTMIESNKKTSDDRTKIISAEELLQKELPPLRYIIEDMLIETGYGIISGRPKCGKSWLMLNLCIALASGGKFLGKFNCTKTKVLYLALEDSEYRMQNRLKTILNYEPPESRMPLDNLYILYKIERYNDGGKEQLRHYIEENDIKAVVIDTQKRFTAIGRSSYDSDFEYKIGQELQSFAFENNICLISVLHTRKSKGNGFPIDEIAGTYGISAGADFWAILRKGKQSSNFCFGGRDILDKELLLTFNEQGIWNAIGNENEIAESQVQVKWEKIIISEDMQKKDVVSALMREYECHHTTAYRWLHEAIGNKILYSKGKYIFIV